MGSASFNLHVGGRCWYAFRRAFLLPDDSYTVEDIEGRRGSRSELLTGEAELTTNLPLGPGNTLVELAGSMVTGAPDGYFVYEETL